VAETTTTTFESVTVKVVTLPFITFAPYYIGLEEGYFEHYGIDVELVEFTLLHREVRGRIGGGQLPVRRFGVLLTCALVAAAAAWAMKMAFDARVTFLGEATICVVFALTYGGATLIAGVPEARSLIRRLRRV
jgi:hypothetical protein